LEKLIKEIDEIIKYGLNPNLIIIDKEKDLEKHLIGLYSCYFDIEYQFDEADYEVFDKPNYSKIRQNVISNFKEFGFYNDLSNIQMIDKQTEIITGDAIDDLTDIVLDLLEIKWRAENNSLNDALWFFQFTFHTHTQQHLIGLLKYMQQR
jgi:hypothetical protein